MMTGSAGSPAFPNFMPTQAMTLTRSSVLLLSLLAGCAGPGAGLAPGDWAWPFTHPHVQGAGPHASASDSRTYAQFHFDWQLSGDPEIMPVQVFDDGVGMWLQFSPEGAWPAVFAVGAGGWRPLSYRREPPYMVLDAIHDHLELRGGHLRGHVKRVPQAGAATAPTLGAQPALKKDLGPTTVLQPVPAPGTSSVPPVTPATSANIEHRQLPAYEPASESGSPSDYLGAPVQRYAVSPSDRTIRQALERWAGTAGWAFSSEHWAVDVDIPLVGAASFEADFKTAVRDLLAATELGDRPLQPCFYSNRVLRVVPYAQPCDRRGNGVVS